MLMMNYQSYMSVFFCAGIELLSIIALFFFL